MSATTVYVFSGTFESIEEACLYSQPQWEAEPSESASDEEYAAWEDRNPSHNMLSNIGPYLDEDFIETIDFDPGYLSGIKISKSDIAHIRSRSLDANILVLVYEQALGGFSLRKAPVSNSSLTYCGHFYCDI
ncbi:hypothetical protein [Marinobacterium marinum]|uniref:Uncharacterized protein n=1 Tax=Marinobacterium marinum TaxID=2756129 RepID=A0A7W1WYQ5_9GAMM|nr:hypothetical protein [Marinobacterium marinum]MBA4502536.1 hypothetical protein [Marinobacterium marinum]